MDYTVTLEVEISPRHTIEYEVTVRADGLAEAVKEACDQAWEAYGEDAPLTIRRIGGETCS